MKQACADQQNPHTQKAVASRSCDHSHNKGYAHHRYHRQYFLHYLFVSPERLQEQCPSSHGQKIKYEQHFAQLNQELRKTGILCLNINQSCNYHHKRIGNQLDKLRSGTYILLQKKIEYKSGYYRKDYHIQDVEHHAPEIDIDELAGQFLHQQRSEQRGKHCSYCSKRNGKRNIGSSQKRHHVRCQTARDTAYQYNPCSNLGRKTENISNAKGNQRHYGKLGYHPYYHTLWHPYYTCKIVEAHLRSHSEHYKLEKRGYQSAELELPYLCKVLGIEHTYNDCGENPECV